MYDLVGYIHHKCCAVITSLILEHFHHLPTKNLYLLVQFSHSVVSDSFRLQ